MLLILLSLPDTFEKECAMVSELFEQGMTHFHLRKPSWTEVQMAAWLDEIPAKYLSNIVIHSNYSLIKKYPLKGIHLTEQRRESYDWNQKYPVISTSFHTIEVLKREAKSYEYCFLSPIFNSISKPDYQAGWELVVLEKMLQDHKLPIVALGGIDDSNIQEVKRLGFYGAGVLGAVWLANDPVQSYLKLKECATI